MANGRSTISTVNMMEHCHQSCGNRELKVVVGTFNMGNAPCTRKDGINEFVPPLGLLINEDGTQAKIDILVLGLQESTYVESLHDFVEDVQQQSLRHEISISKMNVEADISKHVEMCVFHLTKDIEEVLGSSYYQMFIYGRKSLELFITGLDLSRENTGAFHVLPNKGGLCTSLFVDQTSLTFISCHLAAHEGVSKCFARNMSTMEILGAVRSRHEHFDPSLMSHHTFFMGDMNYRVTFDPTVPETHVHNPSFAHKLSISSSFSSLSSSSKARRDVHIEIHAEAEKHVKEEAKKKRRGLDLGLGSLFGKKISEKISAKEHKKKVNMILLTKEMGHHNAEDVDADEDLMSTHPNRVANFATIFDFIEAENWERLLHFDELNRELAAGRCLNGFTALQPRFPPTFKRIRSQSIKKIAQQRIELPPPPPPPPQHQLSTLDPRSVFAPPPQPPTESIFPSTVPVKLYDVYAENSPMGSEDNKVSAFYNAKRLPSYTDRILHKSLPGFRSNLEVLGFESCEGVMSSDHKPVRAVFRITTTAGASGISVAKELVEQQVAAAAGARAGAVAKTPEGSYFDLQFRNFKGEDLPIMDMSGKSDPYVVISADPEAIIIKAESHLTSSVCAETLNPSWKDILRVRISTTDLDGLAANAHLFISVWDSDLLSADDFMGLAVISLAEVIDGVNLKGRRRDFHFTDWLLANGERQGSISCDISLPSVTAVFPSPPPEGESLPLTAITAGASSSSPPFSSTLSSSVASPCSCSIA